MFLHMHVFMQTPVCRFDASEHMHIQRCAETLKARVHNTTDGMRQYEMCTGPEGVQTCMCSDMLKPKTLCAICAQHCTCLHEPYCEYQVSR